MLETIYCQVTMKLHVVNSINWLCHVSLNFSALGMVETLFRLILLLFYNFIWIITKFASEFVIKIELWD